jgi:DNA-binding winged helix-turn-helix (wHTH) protein
MQNTPSQLTFTGHRIDVGTRQVFRGEMELHLSPKAFDLLQLLIENRTRAMSKGELYDRLWPGTFVTETNLVSLVAELRRALGDPPRNPSFIRTVHRFGYAFCGQIDDDPRSAAVSPSCWIVWRGQEIPLRDGENIIGREDGVQVRIDAPSISRRHARIVVSTRGLTFEDLGSKNGSFLRKKPVKKAVPLADLDELTVGSVQMIVRIMRGNVPTQTIAD